MNVGLKELKISVLAIGLLSVLAGGVYPLTVWAIGRLFFPEKADGSLIVAGGRVVGSSLLAQGFSDKRYFHPRPSAAERGYRTPPSGGHNLGPLSRRLQDDIRARIEAYRAENGLGPEALVPADAATSSASGLDPHISVANARLQARRVAQARGTTMAEILRKIEAHTEGRTFGFLGEPRVNVLLINLDLEGIIEP